jgi:hypothetical protein
MTASSTSRSFSIPSSPSGCVRPPEDFKDDGDDYRGWLRQLGGPKLEQLKKPSFSDLSSAAAYPFAEMEEE